MRDAHPLTLGRFRPARLFRPRSVAVIGDDTEAGAEILANLRAGGFAGEITAWRDGVALAAAGGSPDLAVVCSSDIAGTLATLGRQRVGAAIVTGHAADLATPAWAAGIATYGPNSFGLAVPAIGLHAIRAPQRPRPGRAALLSQSGALCRAVLDWAEPNGVGFSHVIGIGGNHDIGFSVALDWLSRDAGTGVILLDLRRIRDARRFLSAARAAARLRPVVAIGPGVRVADPSGEAEAALCAALRRAGVLTVETFDDFLAAAEMLTRARAPRGERLAIVANAAGPARLAADALLRAGLTPAPVVPETASVLELVPGRTVLDDFVVHVAAEQALGLAETASLLSGASGTGGVLVVHAPTGPRDDVAMTALAAAARAIRVPLLVCVMGETTGAAHRRALAEAGVAVFASPEQAVRGFAQLVQNRRNRAAARELPPSTIVHLAPDRDSVRTVVVEARREGRTALMEAELARILAAYGLDGYDAQAAEIVVHSDPLFGPVIALVAQGRRALDLPPLNLPLAQALAARIGILASEATADALVRVSQLLVDFAEIATLRLSPAGAALDLCDPGRPPPRLELPPYPAELATPFTSGAERLLVRPIRPEDAAAHAAFFSRLPAEDIRYRFFSALRELSREQIARMTQIDYEREMAFVAVREHHDGAVPDETLGVARLVREGEGDEGEFAILVAPDMKGSGLARFLMGRLIDWASAIGIREIVGVVLAENTHMLAFVRRLGFRIAAVEGDRSIVEARLTLEAGPRVDVAPPGDRVHDR